MWTGPGTFLLGGRAPNSRSQHSRASFSQWDPGFVRGSRSGHNDGYLHLAFFPPFPINQPVMGAHTRRQKPLETRTALPPAGLGSDVCGSGWPHCRLPLSDVFRGTVSQARLVCWRAVFGISSPEAFSCRVAGHLLSQRGPARVKSQKVALTMGASHGPPKTWWGPHFS